MASTSQKHRNFVKEPMGKKSVSAVAGVGEVSGRKFEAAGYDKANDVLGKYLSVKKDEKEFKNWAKSTGGGSSRNVDNMYQCIKEWSDEFL